MSCKTAVICIGFAVSLVALLCCGKPNPEDDSRFARWRRFSSTVRSIGKSKNASPAEVQDSANLCAAFRALMTSSDYCENDSVLRGIPAWYVLVEEISTEDQQSLGRSSEQVTKDIELRLRKSGVAVEDSGGFLVVSLHLLRGRMPDIVVFSVTLHVPATVLFIDAGDRGYPKWADAPVWQTSRLGVVTADNANSVREAVGDAVDDPEVHLLGAPLRLVYDRDHLVRHEVLDRRLLPLVVLTLHEEPTFVRKGGRHLGLLVLTHRAPHTSPVAKSLHLET